MQPLEKSLRNRLERTVTDARTVAETVVEVALDQLGVGDAALWYSLGSHYDGKDGDRINDHHLSLAEKHAAKENSNYSYSGVGK
jgi:hypothetical protein